MRGRWDKEPGQSSRQQRRLCREKGVAKGVRGGRERGERGGGAQGTGGLEGASDSRSEGQLTLGTNSKGPGRD